MADITVQFNSGIKCSMDADGEVFKKWLYDDDRPSHSVIDSKGEQIFFKAHIAFVRIEKAHP